MSNRREHGYDNPYVQYSVASSSSSQPGKRDKVWNALGRCGKVLEGCGKMAGEAAENVWHHIKVSPSIADAAMARVAQGTKLIVEGGPDRVFRNTFGLIPGEKYLHSYACYLYAPSGPVNGTLYISSKRLAFCSESPVCNSPSPDRPQCAYYQVVIELNRLAEVYPSPNLLSPSEKDIHVVTKDRHEFWFTGFLWFSRALKSLHEALMHCRAYGKVLDRCGKRFENNTKNIKAAADSVWNHLKLSSSVTDAAMVRLCRGTKFLTEGGYEKVFQQTFGFVDGDKYLDSFACYLSTSSGPVNGTLYISTKRVAFYSEFPLCHNPSPGQPLWIHYKVVIAVDQLRNINASSNLKDPSQKYIQIITRDFHEFWFMGFVSYNTAVKTLTDALQRSRA